jgi:NTE family protein
MSSSVKKISLAIQGGGSHEAFVWGVLDGLLEDGRIAIEGMSGTSGGGLNALACLQGVAKNGTQGARQSLKEFWQKVSELSALNPCQPPFSDRMVGHFGLENSLSYSLFYQMIMNFSPYQWNPMNFNPLDFLIRHFFDFDKMNQVTEMKVFLCATHIRSGKLKIFSNPHLSAEAAMASACIPVLFQAVCVGEEYYWDGGAVGNPVIFPLIDGCETADIVVIQLTRSHFPHVPMTSKDIRLRDREISFNLSLLREMRAIAFVTKLIDQGKVMPRSLKKLHMHLIRNEEVFSYLPLDTAYNTNWDFVQYLFYWGRRTAHQWLKDNFDDIGVKSTVDLEHEFVQED